MTDFVQNLKENLKENHNLHATVIAGSVYYVMNKNGNPNALKYGLVKGIATAVYMSYFSHSLPDFSGNNSLGDFNKGLAELFGG